MALDVVSGYALAAARVAAWAGVSALVFRGPRPSDFGLLVLLRGTITLVGYTSVGLGPAMVRLLTAAVARRSGPAAPALAVPAVPTVGGLPSAPLSPVLLEYRSSADAARPPTELQTVFSSGACLALVLAVLALVATAAYAANVGRVHVLGPGQEADAGVLVMLFGLGTALRIVTEPVSAALQTGGRLAADNLLTAAAELLWLALVFATPEPGAAAAAAWWLTANLALFLGRLGAATLLVPAARAHPRWVRPKLMWALLSFGTGVLVAQLADFLYAPAAYVVINRLLPAGDLTAYAPAVQIAAALLLLVGGLATAVFPRAAAAHAAGDLAAVRRYYLLGTAAAAAALAAAAGSTVLLARWILVAWLGEDLPHTRAILPLVLVHTVVGGSAAVGRSVLLGMGRVRALTVSALVAGVMNVVLGIVFAVGLGWGLRGIVLGTVMVVVARAGIWMPWYVLRTLRRESAPPDQTTFF